jgi:hypothetical protein
MAGETPGDNYETPEIQLSVGYCGDNDNSWV